MTEPYTPTTEEVRMAYVGEPEHWLDDKVAAEFDRWYVQEIEKAEYSGYLRAREEARQEFADELTRKGVYLFNIHDIRKYAEGK